ncbi:unnamed protein product [Schistosoma mattheei]|uniref:Uncharacterized protein n=1 Tax=Schistosoma mattheei TaxID=31246 RepID=A0A3P8HCU2_9TREM|nr:unnamed protein product [Schistosoma mattheei]
MTRTLNAMVLVQYLILYDTLTRCVLRHFCQKLCLTHMKLVFYLTNHRKQSLQWLSLH